MSEVLRRLADYLEEPYWLENKMHYRAIESLKTYLKRLTKDNLILKAKSHLKISIDPTLCKKDIIDTYIINFIKQMEE